MGRCRVMRMEVVLDELSVAVPGVPVENRVGGRGYRLRRALVSMHVPVRGDRVPVSVPTMVGVP